MIFYTNVKSQLQKSTCRRRNFV